MTRNFDANINVKSLSKYSDFQI